MNHQNDTPSGSRIRWVWATAGILLFGVMMGERTRLDAGWQQALAAGLAACVLVFCISKFKANKRSA